MTILEVFDWLLQWKILWSVQCYLQLPGVIEPFENFCNVKAIFIIQPPKVYHGGFHTWYNLWKATNLADRSWPEDGRALSLGWEVERPLNQYILPIGRIL